jgi:hypothetical protein
MAHIRETAAPVGPSSAGGKKPTEPSFEFPRSQFTKATRKDLARRKWILKKMARPSGCELVPTPRADEVVVFVEFLNAGLRFPVSDFVLAVLRRFNFRFHQLTSSCFPWLAAYIWVCHSAGLEPDVDGFVCSHTVHLQPRKLGEVDGVVQMAQYGVYTFVPRSGVELPAPAQRNKWADDWRRHWFYYRVGGAADLCGAPKELALERTKPVRTDAAVQVLEALRKMSSHVCTRDLVEEFTGALLWPLWRKEVLPEVKNSRRYAPKGLTGLEVDVEGLWESLLEEAEGDRAEFGRRLVEEVTVGANILVGSIDAHEMVKIRTALGDRRRVNRIFDLAGAEYPDWPSMEEAEAAVASKRKRGGGPGGGGRGAASTSKRG